MKRIVITGGEGLLGQHLRLFLQPFIEKGEAEVVHIARSDWERSEGLRGKVARADAIVHCAGMNRGEENDIYESNMRLVRELLDACDTAGVAPHIVFPSSTHEARDTAYGRSKREGSALIRSWSRKRRAPASVLVLPHVFGEFAKPFHNSGIATMCYQIAKRERSEVNRDGYFELLHARDVAVLAYQHIVDRKSGRIRVKGVRMHVPDVYDLLSGFAEVYRRGEFPILNTGIEIQLFSTLHSCLAWELLPHTLTVHADSRGSLCEVVRGSGAHQAFFSRTNPGVVRGNHYHARKIERFCVVEGEAEIRLRQMLTGEVRTFRVSGEKPVAVDMPTYWTHSIENVGSDMLLTVFWASEHYDPDDSDTFPAET